MASPYLEEAARRAAVAAVPSSHTPGPWNCDQESIDPEWWIVTIKGGLIVANVNAHFHQEANARLIAASPDLLAALQWLSDETGDPASPTRPSVDAMQAARAAIAKATQP